MIGTMRVLVVIGLGLWFLVACASGAPAGDDAMAFVNGALLDGTGADPIPEAVVLVEQGTIVAVGPAAEIDIPENATIVDAQGGTILPGIIDVRASDLLNRLEVSEGQIGAVDLELYLAGALRAGLTTIRATGWDWRIQPDVAALREALAAYGNTIPTVVIVGPMLTHAEGTSYRIYPDQSIGISTVEEARQATEDLIEAGLDQIGFMLALPPIVPPKPGQALPPSLTLEQQKAIVETGHAQVKQVIGQAIYPDEAIIAVEAGVDEIPSWPSNDQPMPDDLIQALVDNSIPIITGYTVVASDVHQGDARRFIDAGGTIAFGTFAPNSYKLDGFYHEMSLMSSIGEMTPKEIIVSATGNAAEAVGLADEIGTLEIGKTADIIVVDGNPLDDLAVFMDGVSIVMKGGELVSLEP